MQNRLPLLLRLNYEVEYLLPFQLQFQQIRLLISLETVMVELLALVSGRHSLE